MFAHSMCRKSAARPKALPHLNDRAEAHMVDVGGKPVTERTATASALVRMSPETARRLAAGAVPKGDVLAVARIAGITAAKRTDELIPLCHRVALTGVEVDLRIDRARTAVETTSLARALASRGGR